MSLYKLTGVTDETTIGRRTKAERKEKRSKRKETHRQKADRRKAERKEKGGGLKRIKKVAASPARIAFLALVDINFLKLANKLAIGINKDSGKVQKFWERVGGSYDKLKKAVSKGSGQAIGSVSAAAAIATATPILIMASTLLKELNLLDRREESELKTATDKGAQDLANDPSLEESFADMPSDNPSAVLPKNPDSKPKVDNKADDSTDEGGNNTMLYVGLGAAALLALTMGKKGNK